MNAVPAKLPARVLPQLPSARECCRQLLLASKTPGGRWIPMTAAEAVTQLVAIGLPVTESDVESVMREMAETGEVVEIDHDAGFRWTGQAA